LVKLLKGARKRGWVSFPRKEKGELHCTYWWRVKGRRSFERRGKGMMVVMGTVRFLGERRLRKKASPKRKKQV